MAIIKLQGEEERRAKIYYEFDSAEGLLGVGGMGDVYRGVCVNELTLGRTPVAIKYIRPCVNYQLVVEHARREASIRIKHENLMEMKGFIEVSQRNVLQEVKKSYYVISELLDGVSLDAVLKGQLCGVDGREIPYARNLYSDYQSDSLHFGLSIAKSILSGVMALHDAGYIHRDIDPTNIMVTRDGKIKLFDFGIARKIGDIDASEGGLLVSKVAYASPELISGEVHKHSKPTDFYMIGILLYQLMTGRLPFEGDLHEIIEQHRSKSVPLAAFKRKDIKAIISKATEKEPQKRFLSAAEFIVAIERAIPGSIPPPSPLPWGKISLGILMLILGTLIYIMMSDPKPPPVVVRDYDYCVGLLAQGKEQEGLALLDSLYKVKDYKATYLKSRLLYKPIQRGNGQLEFLDSEITEIKRNINHPTDKKKAHLILEEAVALNGNDYKSLYQIGCDYLAGWSRTEVDSQNFQKASEYFEKALELAKREGNSDYVSMIEDDLNYVKKLLSNGK